MSVRPNYDENIKKQLIQIVEAHGGKNCKSWTQVARVFQAATGIKVQNTFDLKKKWEIFTNYKEQLSNDEYRMLYLTGIKCKGNHKAGTEEFFSISGKRLYVNQYSKMVGHFLVNQVKQLCQSYFSQIKAKYRQQGQDRFNSRISYVSIHIFMRAINIKDYQDNYVVQKLRQAAIKLEQLLIFQAEHKDDQQIDKFLYYRQIISRKDFKKITFFLDYVNELKQISINLYKENDLCSHPLLAKTIELNKNSLIYQLLIWENDWNSKYQLFQECAAKSDQEEFSMLIKKSKSIYQNIEVAASQKQKPILKNYDLVSTATHKVCNNASKQQIKATEKQSLKQFRGHYYREGQIRTKGITTILFDHDIQSGDEEDNIKKHDENEHQKVIDKVVELYELTFGSKSKNIFH